ncbi:MAG: FAD-binding oxidoreductase, partial [Pseudobdellovibrionaceae bacterium]|nr:FAD-binding oxidoreductase [Pseudobdellovibrionaceae bacterium]
GWFLPVTPGTKFITVGGAIANDIHGKNHHCDGTFGHHLLRFELLRSDGQRLLCSRTQNTPYFHATIGGLGLTGVITWAEFKLKPVFNPFITQEVVRFRNLDEFFVLSEESESEYAYTVSWVDCVAKGKGLGRGLFIRGNHASSIMSHVKNLKSGGTRSVPIDFPAWALNSLSVKIFNNLYYRKQFKDFKRTTISYDPFFYPLDSIHHWNRIYGKRGFLQWQCVVPFADGRDAIQELLGRIAKSGYGSFLAVLKTFGKMPAIGMLSFPKEGVTLALDFPMAGPKLFQLLDELDGIVGNAGGAIYPAKDARMSSESFQKFFPRVEEFLQYKDPKFSSSLWRRVHPTK